VVAKSAASTTRGQTLGATCVGRRAQVLRFASGIFERPSPNGS
jgi:hypothetical protein